MAWYPGAQRLELLPEAREQATIRATQLIAHSIIAPWTARRTYEYWRDSTNLESHLGIGYGDIAQYMPTDRQADANYRANRRPDGTGAISVETASNLQGTDPWTPYQVEELIKLGVWAHQVHGIPLRICRSADDPGFGYHSLHATWSPSGTACPGPARIRQFREVVFPGIVARATAPSPEEDDMPDDATLRKMIREETAAAVKSVDVRDTLAWALRHYNGDGQASILDLLQSIPDKSEISHDVLYWLNQSLSPTPESAGEHPLRWVVPSLAAKFRAAADALAAVPAGATPEQIQAAVAAALAAGITLTVTAPSTPN